jgi:hypothetical protein
MRVTTHRRRPGAALGLACLFVAAGLGPAAAPPPKPGSVSPCPPGELRYEKTFELGPLAVQELDFDAPDKAQKLTVTITPNVAVLSAYLLKTADSEAVERAVQRDKEPAAALLLASGKSKGAGKAFTFEAKVLARTAYTLLIKNGNEAAKVKVKVVGR